jgi:FG-GAP-like repeat
LPANYASKSCARAVDIDNDGDLDIFVAGRCVPGKYPMPVSCAVYRNDSKNGKVIFTDVTASVAPGLKDVGMVCDAVWTDFNNDGWVDLILAGEFMPIRFFKNNHGKLEPMPTGLDNQLGWWNSIVPGDFDNDGDIDYVVGNTGQNSFYRPTEQYPVRVYAKDFDKNGVFDALPSLYLPTSGEDSTMREYPAQLREQEISQMIEFRRKFPTYRAYAHATMDSLLTPDELKGALVLKANNFKSAYLRNDGNGQFTLVPLPLEAQFSALFGMVAEDIDGDGNLDVVINGNDYGTEISVGRYDALNGLVLKGDGKGGFKPLSILQSGLFIPGNGKALVKLYNKQGNCLLVASQNRGPLKVFQIKQAVTPVRANKDDVFAMLTLKSGRKRKVEFNYGAGFLSQSARVINADAQVASIEITNSQGQKRVVKF